MRTIREILDACDRSMRKRIEKILCDLGSGWCDELHQIFAASLDQGCIEGVVLEIERHWKNTLQFRPKEDIEKPSAPELLHPVYSMIQEINKDLDI